MTLEAPVAPLAHWALDPAVVHLNHGSYGGCPGAVIDAASAWRVRLEAAPMRFFVLEWQDAINAARAALATFLHAPVDRLGFTPNATTAIAIALANTPVATGDEIITTDHAYRAVRNQLERLATERGARLVLVRLPIPYDGEAAVVAIARAITAKTRLVVVDHITSGSALVLPVEKLAPFCGERGISLVVDGAHAPGQIALDVGALFSAGVTWYAGNNHKWLCAPKGSGFVVAAPQIAHVTPVVTSHGASAEYGPRNRVHAELDWMGSDDPSAHLAVPTAIDEVARLGGDWASVISRNHALVIEMRGRLARSLGTTALAPDRWLGTMAALRVALPVDTECLPLEKQLLASGWEVPIVDSRACGPLVRVSAHLYNHAGEVDRLTEQLLALDVRGPA